MRAIPPPKSELEPEPPRRRPGSRSAGFETDYPNRSDYEAEVAEMARRKVHEGKRFHRNKGPTTEAS